MSFCPPGESADPGADGKSDTNDNNGNMLSRGSQTLVWDIDNRVASITSSGQTTYHDYDYTGMRVKKNSPAGTSLYPFQGYEIDPNGTVTKYIRIGIETVAAKKGTQKLFYHNDHLGSVNVITDINGNQLQLNEYDPWGSVAKSVGAVEATHRFTGKELDPESGLYYYGGRYYDPEIGRFVSADPFIQSPGEPQSFNRYSYVGNNPQNFIDPSGYKKKRHSGWFIFAEIFVGLLSGAGGQAGATANVLGPSIHMSTFSAYSTRNGAGPILLGSLISIVTAGVLGPTGLGLVNAVTAEVIASAVAGAAVAGIQGGNPLLGAANGYLMAGGVWGAGGGGVGSDYPQVACSFCSGLFVGTAYAGDDKEYPSFVYRPGVVTNPNHAQLFRGQFNPTRPRIQHLMSGNDHRGSLASQWGVEPTANNVNIAKMEGALRVHVNDPATQVIYGTSGPQRMTAIHFYNAPTGRVVTINPITGDLQSPTGFVVSDAQRQSLLGASHLGTR